MDPIWVILLIIFGLFVVAIRADLRAGWSRRLQRSRGSKESDFKCLRGNCRNGHGEALFKNGNRYKGQYRQGRKDGQGSFTWRDGRHYTGQWKKGRMHGKGVMTFPLGGRYEGDFVQDLKEGEGCYIWPNGGIYRGKFVGDKRNGLGTYTAPDGHKIHCIWRDDKPGRPL